MPAEDLNLSPRYTAVRHPGRRVGRDSRGPRSRRPRARVGGLHAALRLSRRAREPVGPRRRARKSTTPRRTFSQPADVILSAKKRAPVAPVNRQIAARRCYRLLRRAELYFKGFGSPGVTHIEIAGSPVNSRRASTQFHSRQQLASPMVQSTTDSYPRSSACRIEHPGRRVRTSHAAKRMRGSAVSEPRDG